MAVYRLSERMSMEYGLKATFSTFNNDIVFERLVQQRYEIDSTLTANYRLKENYSAAYISFRINLNKTTDIKTGLRYEYTNSNLFAAGVKNIRPALRELVP